MEHIHISTLNQYVLCPYAYRYSDDWPIAIENTYKGELLNTAVANGTAVDYTPLVNFYAKEIDSNIKARRTVGKVMIDAAKYIEELKERIKDDSKLTEEELEGKDIKYEHQKYHPIYFFQEQKLFYRIGKDLLVGTPDLFYYDRKNDLRVMEDFKHSSKFWYGNPEILENDCQLWIYPLMIMSMMSHTMKVDKMLSRICLFDKNNGKMSYEWQRTIHFKDAEEFLHDTYERYKMSQTLDDYQPRKNPKCKFCDLKPVCWAWEWESDEVEFDEIDSLLD